MKENYLVSIVMPTYNSEEFINQTILSVISQTYKNWELIITDDASIDKTCDLVKVFCEKDRRVKLFQLGKNNGAAVARNNCLEHVNGRYIAFLDSDDLWKKDKLAIQIDFMQKNNIPISFTSYEFIDVLGNNLNKVIRANKNVDYNGYLKNTIIGMSTSMIDTSLVSNVRFKDIRTRQDTYLWISLLKTGLIAYGLDIVLSKYRFRKNSISSNKFKAASQVWKLYYNFERLGFLTSSYYFIFYIFNAIKKRL